MQAINRAAILVRPKPPFFEWARSLEDGLPESNEVWTTVYLVDEPKDYDPENIVRQHFKKIFDEQLGSWHLNMLAWPTPRKFSMFQQWFETEIVDLVLDMAKEPIKHDD
jgi:hypothetical protein